MYLEKLLKIVTPVKESEEGFRDWSEQSSFFEFLADQRQGSSLVLHGSSFNHGSLLLRSILVPVKDLNATKAEVMTHWDMPCDSWSCGLVYGGAEPPHLDYSEPLSDILPSEFKRGQQLVFSRTFGGRIQDKDYYEISQFLTHAHNLHWMPERRAWCRFDGNGDIEDVIKWTANPGRSGFGTANCIAIDRTVMEMQMAATETALVQVFDVVSVGSNFCGWNKYDADFVENDEIRLYFRSHREGPNGSWVRGVQIIMPRHNSVEFGTYLLERKREPKQYTSFITQDWKNQRIVEVSCSPDALASYFDEGSSLPFQISPVFFNAAVLDKYKADPEKYSLEHRSVSCRNAWHLQTYDVNSSGQIHTYITYLGDLPYSEQLYWKSFNEKPKGSISQRAFTTDIKGEWSDDFDPLQELLSKLADLHKSGVKWFTLREPDIVNQVHYPLTGSVKTWNDTLIALAKLVVEGLRKNFFEELAKNQGAKDDPNWNSISWVKEAIRLSGVSDEVIDEVISPLRTVQGLRSKLGAHSGGSEASNIRANLLREYKTPRSHIEHLCARLLRSLQLLSTIIEK